MHTGPVVIADGGEVFGETATVAARVQGAAEPDTVVITAATQRLVGGLFVVEDRGPQMLKGVREPVTLYRVVQPSGVRSRLAVAAGRLTRFVGRDMELGTLVDRWERAADGEGQNVVVLGEAGVGKSGALDEFLRKCREADPYWKEIINFDALVRHGMISREDLDLFQYADDPVSALGLLQAGLAAESEEATPALARSRTFRRHGPRAT